MLALLTAALPASAWDGWSCCFKDLCWSPDSRQLCLTEYDAFSAGEFGEGQVATGKDGLLVVDVLDGASSYLLPSSVQIPEQARTDSSAASPAPTVCDTIMDSALAVAFADGTVATVALPVEGQVRVGGGEVSPDRTAVLFNWSRVDEPGRPWTWSVIGLNGEGWRECAAGGEGGPVPPVWIGRGASVLGVAQGNGWPTRYQIVEPDGGYRTQVVCEETGTISLVLPSPDRMHVVFEIHEAGVSAVGIVEAGVTGFRLIRGARSPQWLGGGQALTYRNGDDIVFVAPDGRQLARQPLANNGYAPLWLSKSAIIFRSGFGRSEYQNGDVGADGVLRYNHGDPVWEINPVTREAKPAASDKVRRYLARVRSVPDGLPVRSPDGKRLAWIETRGVSPAEEYLYRKSRIWVADADGSNRRVLLESPANFEWRGYESDE